MENKIAVNKWANRFTVVTTVFAFISGLVSFLSSWLSYEDDFANLIVEFLKTIGIWWLLPITFVLSIILFMVRVRYRLSYGYAEFVFGLCFAFFPFFFLSQYPEHTELQINLIIRLIGGLYVMVRGLDNIVQGYRQRCGKFPKINAFLDKKNIK